MMFRSGDRVIYGGYRYKIVMITPCRVQDPFCVADGCPGKITISDGGNVVHEMCFSPGSGKTFRIKRLVDEKFQAHKDKLCATNT